MGTSKFIYNFDHWMEFKNNLSGLVIANHSVCHTNTKPSLTSIICIHNQATLTLNPQISQELQNILKRIINIHIEMHPIKPTLTHYNVKFSQMEKCLPCKNPPPQYHHNAFTSHIQPHSPP